jgi:CoA:oxalate CoA-transferase
MDRCGPLSDVTILDLTRVLAGPYCTMVLADLGARVIKIERPVDGDDARAIGPFVKTKSAYFMSLNRGKESIALDLRDPADREIFEKLLPGADVLVENYRAGVMEQLGYGWEMLHARHPRLIYAAASGFGHTGPYAERPAYDLVVQGMGGLMSLTGQPGSAPTRVGTSIGDIAAGLFTAVGVNAALYHREMTGEGTKIDVAMLDCQVALLENAIARYVATGQVPGPLGSRHPSITPFEAFASADGHLIIAAGNDGLFRKLCDALGRSELADDVRFCSNEVRSANADALKIEIEGALREGSCTDWLAALESAGVPCGPIHDVAEVMADPQIAARNMVIRVLDETAGEISMPGNPIKLSAFEDPTTRKPAPDLDSDRRRLLEQLFKGAG